MALSSSLHVKRERVVWSHGSEGLHEMRGLEGMGCLVVWVKGITCDEGWEGRVVSGCMGQRDCMR